MDVQAQDRLRQIIYDALEAEGAKQDLVREVSMWNGSIRVQTGEPLTGDEWIISVRQSHLF